MPLTRLKSLFAYKSWAHRELFALLATLPPEHAQALHGCIRTLNHIYVVDEIFKAHLSAQAHPFAADNTPDTPSVAQLGAAVAATDAWYEQYLARLEPAALQGTIDFEFTDGEPGRMTREEILLHIITHGTYHRGNVGQVLKSIGVAPPRELYTRFLRTASSR